MLPNPPKSIRALTSIILFIHQGTINIVPASNSNPVCLGGKVTVSMITQTFIHVTLVGFPLIPLCYFSIFVKLIALIICAANLVYGAAKHTAHQGNHTLFLLQRQCRLTVLLQGQMTPPMTMRHAYRHSRRRVPCSFIITVGLWLELNFIKYY